MTNFSPIYIVLLKKNIQMRDFDYYDSFYLGMHWFWWVLWIIMLCWIFLIPIDIPGQRNAKEKPIDILKKRLARGEITAQEYKDKKELLEQL